MTTEHVTFELRDKIAVITLDDGKANALSPMLLDQLDAALDRAEAEAKAIVLTGREGRFSAGFDLRVMMSGPEAARDLVTKGGEVLLRCYEIGMPLVIACTGHALAGGALLVATGDTRIGATGEFKIGLNEVFKGMPVPILAHEFARDRLDPRELIASVLQAKIYDPVSAAEAGWLDRTVAPAELEGAAMAEATRLAGLPSTAYKLTKRSLRRQTIEYIRSTLQSNLVEIAGG
jgi:enoyl-CoA hydratase